MNTQSPDELALRVTALEELLTHLQRTVHELDAVVVDQQKQLDAARSKIERYAQLVTQISSSAPEPPRTLEDDKPPHY